jgi:predicted ribosomally synthesized peptide with SipW-like signal peptide
MTGEDDSNGGSEFRLSRRKALAGIGTIGAAVGLGGLGTAAQFTDTEENTFTFTAGGLDGTVEWGASYNGDDVQSFNSSSGVSADNVVVDGENVGAGVDAHFTDVKPGDFGCFSFRYKVENNPAWVAACVAINSDTDGQSFEPEEEIEDMDGDGTYEIQGKTLPSGQEAEGPYGDDFDSDVKGSAQGAGGNAPYAADLYGSKGPGELAENMLILPFYKPPVDGGTSERFDPCIFFDNETESFDPHAYEGSGAVGTASKFWDNSQDDGQGLHPLPVRDAARSTFLDTTAWGSNGNVIQAFSPQDAIVGEGCFFLNGELDDESDNQQQATAHQPGTYYQMGWDWHIPFDAGNELQGDELSMTLGFVFGQTRHNESPQLSNVYDPGENA